MTDTTGAFKRIEAKADEAIFLLSIGENKIAAKMCDDILGDVKAMREEVPDEDEIHPNIYIDKMKRYDWASKIATLVKKWSE